MTWLHEIAENRIVGFTFIRYIDSKGDGVVLRLGAAKSGSSSNALVPPKEHLRKSSTKRGLNIMKNKRFPKVIGVPINESKTVGSREKQMVSMTHWW
jgi:hypothetical protein